MSANPKHIVTGRARLSYANIFTPKPGLNGGEAKYSCTVLIPKTDTLTRQRLDTAISAALQEGISKCWSGVQPPNVAIPIYDGDGGRPSDGMPFGAECKGHWVFTASSKFQPQVVDRQGNPLTGQPSEIYSGVYAFVGLDFFPYANTKKGVGCSLSSIIKIEDGEPLGGRVSVNEDLAALGAQPQYGYAPPSIDPITGLPA